MSLSLDLNVYSILILPYHTFTLNSIFVKGLSILIITIRK